MKIGFIGIGLMGAPLAQRLIDHGFEVTVYNRTVSKLNSLVGANIADRPDQVIQNSDCIILMLTDAAAIADLILNSITRNHLIGKTIIQMGTISPQESQQIKTEINSLGGDYLEAPVLGSIPEAKTGKLLLMVGASKQLFDRYLPLLKVFGESPLLIGEVGAGAAMKLALNQLISSLTTAFATSLGYLEYFGVNIDQFMEILRSSALYAPTFDKKLQRMIDRDYSNPNFPTKHLLKDTNLFINSAADSGLNLQSVQGIIEILKLAQNQGLADSDYSALYNAINLPPERR